MKQPPLDKLWRTSIGPDIPAPDWVNVQERLRMKPLTTYAKVTVEDDRLRVIFNDRLFKLINIGLTPFVSLLIAFLGFKSGSNFIGIFMLILGTATTLLLFWTSRHLQQRGDYLVIDRKAKTIALPQQCVLLPFSDIDRFQSMWAIHYQRTLRQELYLLARDKAGSLLRYPVMSALSRKQMRLLVEFSGISMEERHKRPLGLFAAFTSLEHCKTDINNP